MSGEPGQASAGDPPPALPGFRPLRVVQIGHESNHVVSLELESADERPLAFALARQFVVLRLRTKP
ncbi:MAG: domain containing protein [Chthoniobacteraceae bacterium]|nr:domain containing protein [Chthoniobacteraceae bacterium]